MSLSKDGKTVASGAEEEGEVIVAGGRAPARSGKLLGR